MQVKLRGFRIELGEVESVLMEAPGVKLAAAVVMKDPSAADHLVGFVSPATVDCEAIIAALKQRLPAHFVPSLIVPLPEMPLSPAGKVGSLPLFSSWPLTEESEEVFLHGNILPLEVTSMDAGQTCLQSAQADGHSCQLRCLPSQCDTLL